MHPQSRLTQNLRATVVATVAGTQSRQQANELVALCHSLCTAILRQKIALASLESRFHYASYRDLAYDVVAELFRQDERGVFVKLKGYFEGINLTELDDAEILTHMRRLVHSRVNQEIFRIYTEIDPHLAKILRNIKLAVQELESFAVITRAGEWHLVPAMAGQNAHLPIIDAEQLEREFSGKVSGGETIPVLLTKLSVYLREQDEYARMVPVMTVARVFRAIFARGEMTDQEAGAADTLDAAGIQDLIKRSCAALRSKMEKKYTGTKGLPVHLYRAYFVAVEETMMQRFLGDDGSADSLYETLRDLRPDITYERYYRDHRAKLEYLARLSHEHIAKRLRRELEV